MAERLPEVQLHHDWTSFPVFSRVFSVTVALLLHNFITSDCSPVKSWRLRLAPHLKYEFCLLLQCASCKVRAMYNYTVCSNLAGVKMSICITVLCAAWNESDVWLLTAIHLNFILLLFNEILKRSMHPVWRIIVKSLNAKRQLNYLVHIHVLMSFSSRFLSFPEFNSAELGPCVWRERRLVTHLHV